MCSMLIRDFPNELLLIIGDHLGAPDLYHLILVNRRFTLLLSRLRSLATQPAHAQAALFWAVLSNNRPLARHMLENAKGSTMMCRRHAGAGAADARKPQPRGKAIFTGKLTDKRLGWVMGQRARALPVIALRQSSNGGEQPVQWAIQREHHALLRLALATTDGKAMGLHACSGALLFAASRRKVTAMGILLDWAGRALKGEYRDLLNQVFFRVVEKGLEEAIVFLHTKGPDVNMRSPEGRPLLATATGISSYQVVKLLVDSGANVNSEDASWHSPLYMALTRYRTAEGEEILKLLRACNAELSIHERGSGISLGMIEEGKGWR